MSTVEKNDYARAELVRAFASLLESKTHSDLTIICGGQKTEVHSLIVCCRSDFFRAACEAGFKEAETRTVELKEDNPFMVTRMIKYLYTLDYADCNMYASGLRCEREDPTLSASEINVQMYSMGDKYGIWGLKKIAEIKFERAMAQKPCYLNVLALVPKIYEATPEHDRGLRDVAVRLASVSLTLLTRSSKFKEVVALVPEFACDLINWASQNATKPGSTFLGDCRRCHKMTFGKTEKLRCTDCGHLKDAPSQG